MGGALFEPGTCDILILARAARDGDLFLEEGYKRGQLAKLEAFSTSKTKTELERKCSYPGQQGQ